MGAMRRAASLLCLAGALLATVGLLPAQAQDGGGPVVEVFEASGVLDASGLGALRRDLGGAGRRGARGQGGGAGGGAGGGGRGSSSCSCRASAGSGSTRPRSRGPWPGPGCR